VLTIYLDQKDWIGLAKAIYSAKATDPQRVVARNLKALADSGVVRFPVSDTHLMEASKIRNQQRRLQLASVFARFAQGWFLASRQARLAFEIERAIARLLELRLVALRSNRLRGISSGHSVKGRFWLNCCRSGKNASSGYLMPWNPKPCSEIIWPLTMSIFGR
jgi:hypothetical protein